VNNETLSYPLLVNGTELQVENAWLGESLLYVLRERLALPGAKNACEQGECGSCSVKVDGDLVCACLVLAASATGCVIDTVEGVAAADPFVRVNVNADSNALSNVLSSVQQAFVDEGAVQCGFCTPGLIMAVHELLDRVASPSEMQVREAISGNLCRCTGYGRIFEAVNTAITLRASEPGSNALPTGHDK
jgi:aerobic carbon-monoxide dehydrogenase small subunit